MTTYERDISLAAVAGSSSEGGWNKRASSLVVPSPASKPINPMTALVESVALSTGFQRRSIVRQLKRDIDTKMKQNGVASPRQRRKLRRSISGQLQKIAATRGGEYE